MRSLFNFGDLSPALATSFVYNVSYWSGVISFKLIRIKILFLKIYLLERIGMTVD